MIFTDGSVKKGVGSGWAYSANVEGVVVAEESGAFVHTTSSMWSLTAGYMITDRRIHDHWPQDT